MSACRYASDHVHAHMHAYRALLGPSPGRASTTCLGILRNLSPTKSKNPRLLNRKCQIPTLTLSKMHVIIKNRVGPKAARSLHA